MELVRHGHACFSVRDHLDRIWLFDPYRPDGLGGRFNLALPDIQPTGIFSTHSHEDHAWRCQQWRDVPFHEQDFEDRDLRLTCRTISHDDCGGSRMGFSRTMRLEIQVAPERTITVVHAGDASDIKDEALQDQCASADVLILPAGGTFTMGPADAAKLAQQSQARCTVLTHFREPGVDLPMLTPEEAFASINTAFHPIESGHLILPIPPDTPSFVWMKARMQPTSNGSGD